MCLVFDLFFRHMILQIPTDREIFDLPTSLSWFEDNGFLISSTKPIKRTHDLSEQSISRIQEILAGQKVYGMVETSKMSPMDKETRISMTKRLPDLYHALAIVSANQLGVMLARLLFAINSQPVPTQIFSNYPDAINWLKEMKKKNLAKGII
jgi:hypothetical protein